MESEHESTPPTASKGRCGFSLVWPRLLHVHVVTCTSTRHNKRPQRHSVHTWIVLLSEYTFQVKNTKKNPTKKQTNPNSNKTNKKERNEREKNALRCKSVHKV